MKVRKSLMAAFVLTVVVALLGGGWATTSWGRGFSAPDVGTSGSAGCPSGGPNCDLGDAPGSNNNFGIPMTAYPSFCGPPGVTANFPTVFGVPAPNGPRHDLTTATSFLGKAVTGEADADLPPDADGITNIDPPTDSSDRDGKDDGLITLFLSPGWASLPLSLSYWVTSGPGAPSPLYVNAWIDWNQDGDWADSPPAAPAPEWVVVDQPLVTLNPGTYLVTSPFFPCGNLITGQCYWLRLTLSEQCAPFPDGAGLTGACFVDGETEDYLLMVGEEGVGEEEFPSFDLGDAPDRTNHHSMVMTAYPSGGPPGVIANFPTVFDPTPPLGLPQGPLHLGGNAYLGPWLSWEIFADQGKDQDGVNNIWPPTDTPDQDGFDDGVAVPFLPPHCTLTSFSYQVTLGPAAPDPLLVNVWFDWNRDGDWADTLTCVTPGDAREWAVQDQVVSMSALGGPGTYMLTTPPFLPFNPTPGQPIWMRITLAEQMAPAPQDGRGPPGTWGIGGYRAGETEDYYFIPSAPTPTPTSTPTATRTSTPTPTGTPATPTPTATPTSTSTPTGTPPTPAPHRLFLPIILKAFRPS